jgi:hypothetical protein
VKESSDVLGVSEGSILDLPFPCLLCSALLSVSVYKTFFFFPRRGYSVRVQSQDFAWQNKTFTEVRGLQEGKPPVARECYLTHIIKKKHDNVLFNAFCCYEVMNH